MNVLIAYSSKYGSTKEIAENVCKILQTFGLDVNIEKASASLKMDNYDAIILGSGVYIGKWLPGMENLLKKRFSLLQEKKVWIFSDGPTSNTKKLFCCISNVPMPPGKNGSPVNRVNTSEAALENVECPDK